MDWTESVRKCHGQLMPTPFAPHRVSVCLVAVPEMATGVLNGLYEVFTFVGTGWEMLTGWPTGPRRFLPRIVAEDRTPFRNLAGLPIAPDLDLRRGEARGHRDRRGSCGRTRRGDPRPLASRSGLAATAAGAGCADLLGLHRRADAGRGGTARRRGGHLSLGGSRPAQDPAILRCVCAPSGCWCRPASSIGW